MNGVVTQLKPRGFIAEMDSPTDGMEPGTRFQIYRVVDGGEVVVGTGVSRKAMPPSSLKVNPDGSEPLGEVQVGDLVRSV